MKAKIRRVLWYKRMSLAIYLIKASWKVFPLKVPELFKDLKEKASSVRERS